ncbi:hypothetical protein HK103_003703 [Boothiomyces macroporosus]|uniref:Protein kinase domain-containing protein n=1 Tax=Boothiomyces macroporosus TaxID=261099 RepID=A0AAD5Y4F7_9FUNG|nr:hypothetical protein HK103_003703 [Boothiomyces macroporosus]
METANTDLADELSCLAMKSINDTFSIFQIPRATVSASQHGIQVELYESVANLNWTTLASGAYGKTYKDEQNNTVCKILLSGLREEALKEFSVLVALTVLNFPGVVHVSTMAINGTDFWRLGYDLEQNKIVILMNMIDGVTVSDIQNDAFDRYRRARTVVCLADTLNLLHSYDIYHYDIHGGNVIITSNGDAVLIDLGACRRIDTPGPVTLSDDLGFNNIVVLLLCPYEKYPEPFQSLSRNALNSGSTDLTFIKPYTLPLITLDSSIGVLSVPQPRNLHIYAITFNLQEYERMRLSRWQLYLAPDRFIALENLFNEVDESEDET